MVLLVAAETRALPALHVALTDIGAKPVHSCAWVLDYREPAEHLGSYLRQRLLPGSRCVISEVTGNWVLL